MEAADNSQNIASDTELEDELDVSHTQTSNQVEREEQVRLAAEAAAAAAAAPASPVARRQPALSAPAVANGKGIDGPATWDPTDGPLQNYLRSPSIQGCKSVQVLPAVKDDLRLVAVNLNDAVRQIGIERRLREDDKARYDDVLRTLADAVTALGSAPHPPVPALSDTARDADPLLQVRHDISLLSSTVERNENDVNVQMHALDTHQDETLGAIGALRTQVDHLVQGLADLKAAQGTPSPQGARHFKPIPAPRMPFELFEAARGSGPLARAPVGRQQNKRRAQGPPVYPPPASKTPRAQNGLGAGQPTMSAAGPSSSVAQAAPSGGFGDAATVRFGSVEWPSDLDELRVLVYIVAKPAWDSVPALFAAVRSVEIDDDEGYVRIVFPARALATRFVDAWAAQRVNAGRWKKAQAHVITDLVPSQALKLVSWNIHGDMAVRATTQWFQHLLAQCDIVVLQETHLTPGDESQLCLPLGYDCYALSRPRSPSGRHQGGGLLAIYRAALGVHVLTPPGETEVMLLRVHDLVLVNVYLPPPTSPWIVHLRGTPDEHLRRVLMPFAGEADHHLLVLGDFNARVGTLSASLPRISPDTTVTTRGRALRRLCVDLALHILNGTAYHTPQSRLRYTSFQPAGSAVVDYALASRSLVTRERALTLHVRDPWLSWSDHAPIALTLSVPAQPASSRRMLPGSRKLTAEGVPRPLTELDAALQTVLCEYSVARDSARDLYGPVTEDSPPLQAYLAAAIAHTDMDGGASAFLGPCHPLNLCICFVGAPASRPQGVALAALALLHSVPPSRTLHIYSVQEHLARSVCHWGQYNASRDWKVPLGRELRAIACVIRARSAPTAFFCPPSDRPLHALPQPYHEAHLLAMQAAQTRCAQALSLAVYQPPPHWPILQPSTPVLSLHKVHTPLKPVAPTSEPALRPAPSQVVRLHHGDVSWADLASSSPPALRNLRRANLRSIMDSLSDQTFWRCLRNFLGDQPRPPAVTAEQLRTSFAVRMNPPAQLSPDADRLVHAVHKLYAGTLPNHTSDPTPEQHFSRPITIEEVDAVKNHVRTHAKHSAVGLDGIGYDAVLEIPSSHLRDLFQLCVDRCAVPTTWLTAIITAVKKPHKDAASPESYRTIGLESCLLKTLTLLIDRRLREWAESTGRLPDYQSGFRKGCRTVNNAFVLRTLIDKARSLGRPLYVVYLDLANAFPSVDQPTLWTKLTQWGAAGPMVDLLRTIYASLEYVVRFYGETTTSFRALAGILIGDPASPVLWILIISDFRPHRHNDDVIVGGIPISHLWLADDGMLVCMSAEGMSGKLDDFDRFRARRFLTVSVSKTAASLFGPLPLALPSLRISGGFIQYVDTYVYTGTAFTTTTPDIFAEHYARRALSAEKISHASFSLESYTGRLPPQVALALYRARVEPHLTFGCEVALDVHAPSYERLERVQTSFLRRALHLGSRSQLAPLFSETGVMPIRYRRLQLAIQYAQYALAPGAPVYPAAALREAHALAVTGHSSWWTDLACALASLPIPVTLPVQRALSLVTLGEAARDLNQSLADHIYTSVLASARLPILATRIRLLPTQPPALQALCKWRTYLNLSYAPHREAFIRLLVSDHALAVEALRRASPPIPHHRRICRFCCKRSAIETELHVLLECTNEALCALRDDFFKRAEPRLPKLPRVRVGWTWERQFDLLMGVDALLPDLAEFVYEVFQLVDSTPPLILHDDVALLDLQE